MIKQINKGIKEWTSNNYLFHILLIFYLHIYLFI